jgi:predicted DNA-binding protein YlxM (UPF0122 family)
MRQVTIQNNYILFEDGRLYSKFTKSYKKIDCSRIYPCYSLSGKKHSIHRLLAEHFIVKIPGKNQVNHIDGNKNNFTLSNLEWVSAKENMKHAVTNKLLKPSSGENHYKRILTLKDINKIITLVNRGLSFSEIALKFKVSRSAITRVVTNKTWKSVNKKIDFNKKASKDVPKPVIDQYGNYYESITQAALERNLSIGNISLVLSGKRRHTKGFIFKLYKEKNDE